MSRNGLTALVFAMLLPLNALGQGTDPWTEDTPSEGRIHELIAQLGSPVRMQRDLATEELARLGEAALEALKRAVDHPDAEIQRRASELVDQLRAEIACAATLVDLDWKTLPVRLAVEDLAEKTGLPLKLSVPQAKARRPTDSRWITLQEQDVPVLKALDQVARVGSLQIRWPPRPDMPILLAPGPAADFPASYEGPFAVRLRGLQLTRSFRFGGTPKRTSRLELQFDVVAEPHVTLLATHPIVLNEALDERGRSLTTQASRSRRPAFRTAPTWGIRSPLASRSFQLRSHLTLPDPIAERLQSIEGEATVDLLTGRDLALLIDDVEQSSGRRYEIEGAALLVEDVTVSDERVEISLQIEQTRTPRGDSGGAFYRDSFELVDGGGETLPLHLASQTNTRVQAQTATTQLNLRAERPEGQDGPWRLRIQRAQSHLYTIPFRFENIPLP